MLNQKVNNITCLQIFDKKYRFCKNISRLPGLTHCNFCSSCSNMADILEGPYFSKSSSGDSIKVYIVTKISVLAGPYWRSPY